MFRGLLSSRLIQVGFVFFVVVVSGSLLYSWHVQRTTAADSARNAPIDANTRRQDGTKSSENLGTPGRTDPWEIWIQKQADMSVKASVDQLRSGKTGWTEASLRESVVNFLRQNLDKIKEKNGETPPPLDDTPLTLWTKKNTTEKYTGPQTPEALIAAFHANYTKNGTRRLDEDQRYPPQPFLQTLLDRGITIQNSSEYRAFMSLRGYRKSFEDPVFLDMQADRFGIPPSDIESLEAAFIDGEISRRQRTHELLRADDSVSGGVFIGNPDNQKHLPFYHDRNITYVKRSKSAVSISSVFMGTPLTDSQKFNLLFRGIEPEGIDIIYVDELGKRVEDKPSPITHEEFSNLMPADETPPPQDLWNPDAPVPDNFREYLPENNTGPILDSARKQAEATLQAEREKFHQALRQFDEFANMSDAEFEMEIEKLLKPQLPTNDSLEQELIGQISRKELSPERFEKALETLYQYGPEEGLHKIAADNPELAEYFRKRQQQSPPMPPPNESQEKKE